MGKWLFRGVSAPVESLQTDDGRGDELDRNAGDEQRQESTPGNGGAAKAIGEERKVGGSRRFCDPFNREVI